MEGPVSFIWRGQLLQQFCITYFLVVIINFWAFLVGPWPPIVKHSSALDTMYLDHTQKWLIDGVIKLNPSKQIYIYIYIYIYIMRQRYKTFLTTWVFTCGSHTLWGRGFVNLLSNLWSLPNPVFIIIRDILCPRRNICKVSLVIHFYRK